MLQTSFDTPSSAIQAILSRAVLAADSFDRQTALYDPPDASRISGLTIADIDEAAREVSGLFACGICVKLFY